jgi:perilipin-2
VIKFEDPINRIDDLMCKSLDVVEYNIPIVTYTPEEIYFTTKTYVKAKVEPVLKRADSVKQLTMLDDALSVADKYVDKYLPDKDPMEDDKPKTSSQAVKTIRHVNHFSRKLQRRLTRRTIAEAKLLKKQGYDTVQCFVYFADLLAKDPSAFAEKMKAIWAHLSEDEPENQKPPANIEQLIEMLSREGARRFVHGTNFVVKNVSMVPVHAHHAFIYTTQEFVAIADKLIKYAHLENAKTRIVEATMEQMAKYMLLVEELKSLIMQYFSSSSESISDEPNPNKEAEKPDNKNHASPAVNNKTPKEEKPNSTAANNKASPKDEHKSNVANTTHKNEKAQS